MLRALGLLKSRVVAGEEVSARFNVPPACSVYLIYMRSATHITTRLVQVLRKVVIARGNACEWHVYMDTCTHSTTRRTNIPKFEWTKTGMSLTNCFHTLSFVLF